jgi:N-acetylneuraminic acid mutarotase
MKKTISIVLVLALGLATMSLAAEDTWTRKTNMPTPRALISTSVVDGVIYAIGGGTGPYSDFSTVEAYDPKTDTWTTKINMPTPRAGLSTCAVDGIIYAIGGHWSPGLATVEAYNPVTDNWTSKTPMPTSRGFLSVSVVDGIIYAIGGCKDITGIGLSNVEAYDPKTDTWTEKAPMPTARLLLTTCEVDGIIYAIGGASNFTPGASTLKTVEAYDPATNTWTEKTDMPTSRGGHSTSVIDGIIYAIGGVAYGGGPGLSTVEAYDPITNTWTKKTDMPTPRKFLSCSAVDGKIYAIGGAVLATVEDYDPASDPKPTSVEEVSEATAVPSGYALSQNYPNPFNPQTRIKYQLPHADKVMLKVYNIVGQAICTLVDEVKPAGSYEVVWDGRDNTGHRLASGMYLYQLEVQGPSTGSPKGSGQAGQGFVQTMKMLLLQ